MLRLGRLNAVTKMIRGRWNAEETARLSNVALQAARKLVPSEEATSSEGRSEHVSLLIDALLYAGWAATDDGDWARGAVLLREAAERSTTMADPLLTAQLMRTAGDAQIRAATDAQGRAGGMVLLQTALEYVADDSSLVALQVKASIHAALAETLTRSLLTRVEAASHLAQAVGALNSVDPTLTDLSVVAALLNGAEKLAEECGDAVRYEEFVSAQLEYWPETTHRVASLSHLSMVRLIRHKYLEAAFPACQALRLAHERGSHSEGFALYVLAWCAAHLELSSATTFSLLSCNRMSSAGSDRGRVSELMALHGEELARLDEDARRSIEEDYARDRGASLVREAFGIDMAEVDRANERLGRTGPAALRGHLYMVADFAAQVIAAEGHAEAS